MESGKFIATSYCTPCTVAHWQPHKSLLGVRDKAGGAEEKRLQMHTQEISFYGENCFFSLALVLSFSFPPKDGCCCPGEKTSGESILPEEMGRGEASIESVIFHELLIKSLWEEEIVALSVLLSSEVSVQRRAAASAAASFCCQNHSES